jgi:hypothetical protein
MNEDIRSTTLRLNKAKTLLVVKPLHSSPVHGDFPSLTVRKWELARESSRPLSRFVDFGEVPETYAPVSNEAKRPSRSAKYRFHQNGGRMQLFQGDEVGVAAIPSRHRHLIGNIGALPGLGRESTCHGLWRSINATLELRSLCRSDQRTLVRAEFQRIGV